MDRKFRAFDSKRKSFTNYQILDDFLLFFEKQTGCWLSNKEQRFELMQHTGLKDKNGKEIYEGDVIKLIYFKDGRNREIGKVVFLHYQASFGIIDKDGNEYPLYRNTAEQIEVIGNVYENSELMEKGKNYGK